jgi:hypothetical protein
VDSFLVCGSLMRIPFLPIVGLFKVGVLIVVAFVGSLVVGIGLHYKKIVKNEFYGYPQEWFPSVSATIGTNSLHYSLPLLCSVGLTFEATGIPNATSSKSPLQSAQVHASPSFSSGTSSPATAGPSPNTSPASASYAPFYAGDGCTSRPPMTMISMISP